MEHVYWEGVHQESENQGGIKYVWFKGGDQICPILGGGQICPI